MPSLDLTGVSLVQSVTGSTVKQTLQGTAVEISTVSATLTGTLVDDAGVSQAFSGPVTNTRSANKTPGLGAGNYHWQAAPTLNDGRPVTLAANGIDITYPS